jgi:fructokinase
MTRPLYAGIEAGGTKFVCAVGTSPQHILAQTRFSTTHPDETLERARTFFMDAQAQHGPLAALGVAALGPLDPNPRSATFGCITSTPKPGWGGINVLDPFRSLNLPFGFDTDVNGAALAEWRWGAAHGLENCVYLTVGTGIGGGVLIEGRLVHGLLHPEMGHMRLPHDWESDPFPGCCPYHGDCLEGLAAGPALEKRWGQKAEDLPSGHPAWVLEAHYLALALVNIICNLSPQRIILGGGVMAASHLFAAIRAETRQLLNSYIQSSAILDQIDTYIVPPALGNQAGVCGALALAERAAITSRETSLHA